MPRPHTCTRTQTLPQIRDFYDFVRVWKQHEAEEARLQRAVEAQTMLRLDLGLSQGGGARQQLARL